jgi:hypothetical protein
MQFKASVAQHKNLLAEVAQGASLGGYENCYGGF